MAMAITVELIGGPGDGSYIKRAIDHQHLDLVIPCPFGQKTRVAVYVNCGECKMKFRGITRIPSRDGKVDDFRISNAPNL